MSYGFLVTLEKLQKAAISFHMSVCLSVCPSARTEQLGSHETACHEILYLFIFKNLSIIFNFHHTRTRITGTLHEDQYTFCRILLRSS